MPDIFVYNSLTRQKETFTPRVPGHVSIYACGVTTYDHYHLGHALQAIYFDMICNYLEYAGFKVTYVRNYTDVDDKIINKAKDIGISPMQLSEDIIHSSEEDMRNLGCRQPDFAPRVSQCIPEIIKMIEDLIASGAAYATPKGDVYYRVREKSDYGKLSNRKIDQLLGGTRDIVEAGKHDELDFALWKNDDTPDASWPSPWGLGRPGWHIECSAMSKKHLGASFDIHGGGRDLIFPHHENEIAQSESANHCSYANYWLHSGLLTISHQKMSKSLGNHISLKEFLTKWPSEVLRLSYLQFHYGSNIDFSQDTFKLARRRLCYYYQTLVNVERFASDVPTCEPTHPELQTIRGQFHQAMADDFNSAAAIGHLNQFFKKLNETMTGKNTPEKKQSARAISTGILETTKVFGLLLQEPQTFLHTLKLQLIAELGITESEIDQSIKERINARTNKDFQTADSIRKNLASRGIELMDSGTSTSWNIKYDSDS